MKEDSLIFKQKTEEELRRFKELEQKEEEVKSSYTAIL